MTISKKEHSRRAAAHRKKYADIAKKMSKSEREKYRKEWARKARESKEKDDAYRNSIEEIADSIEDTLLELGPSTSQEIADNVEILIQNIDDLTRFFEPELTLEDIVERVIKRYVIFKQVYIKDEPEKKIYDLSKREPYGSRTIRWSTPPGFKVN